MYLRFPFLAMALDFSVSKTKSATAELREAAVTLRQAGRWDLEVGNSDLVLHGGNSRREPGCVLRLFLLCVGTNCSSQCDFAPIHVNRDPISIGLNAAYQRLFYLLLHVGWLEARLDRDQIGHSFYAPQVADVALGILFLELPL